MSWILIKLIFMLYLFTTLYLLVSGISEAVFDKKNKNYEPVLTAFLFPIFLFSKKGRKKLNKILKGF